MSIPDFQLPIFKHPLPPPRRLTPDEYLRFVEAGYRDRLKTGWTRKPDEHLPVNVRFTFAPVVPRD